MEITAKLTQITNVTEGSSQRGPWRKGLAIFQTEEQYPKTIAVVFWNSKLDEASNIPLGSVCKVQFDIESREFNGKWYTDVKGFSIEVQSQPQQEVQQQPAQSVAMPSQPSQGSEPSSSMPSQPLPPNPAFNPQTTAFGAEPESKVDDLPF